MLIPLVLLLSVAAAPRELAIITVGPDVGRAAEVAAAIARVAPDDVVIAAEDAAAIQKRYAKSCAVTDADCWSRAGIAGAVGGIVLVGPGDQLAVIDVAAVSRRSRAVTVGNNVDPALEALLYPRRFGRLQVATTPADAVVTVDGATVAHDAEVRAGVHDVVVSAVGFTPHKQQVPVAGGETRALAINLVAAAVEAPAVVDAPVVVDRFDPIPVVVAASGGVLLVAGVAGVLLFEQAAVDAIANIRAGHDAASDLEGAEGLQLVSGGVAVVGAAALITGIVMATSEQP